MMYPIFGQTLWNLETGAAFRDATSFSRGIPNCSASLLDQHGATCAEGSFEDTRDPREMGVRVHVFTYLFLYVNIDEQSVYVYIYLYMYIYIILYYMYVYVYIYIYTYTYTHTYKHIMSQYTHPRPQGDESGSQWRSRQGHNGFHHSPR
jgi:hypothetical protein